MYVEDNPANVRLVEAMLNLRPGVRLESAPTIQEGLGLVREVQPQLVLVDLHLPDGSGLDLIGELRSDASRDDVTIVVMSADVSPASREAAMKAGAQHYISKPFRVADLLSTVDGALGLDGPPTEAS